MAKRTAVNIYRTLTTFTYNSVFFLVSPLVFKSIYCFSLTPDGSTRSVGLLSSPSSRKKRKRITPRKNSYYRFVHTILVLTDGQKRTVPLFYRPLRHISVVFYTNKLLKNPSYFSISNPIIMYSRFQSSIRLLLIVYYCNLVRFKFFVYIYFKY